MTAAGVRVIALTTDSVEKNRRVVLGLGLNFAILSDPEGKVLKALGSWDPRNWIATYGYFLLDRDLGIVSQRRGSWEPTDEVKQFFLDQAAGAALSPPAGRREEDAPSHG